MPRNKNFGAMYYVTFNKSITRQDRTSLENKINNLKGLVIHRSNGKGLVFFIPQDYMESVDTLLNWIREEKEGSVTQQMTPVNAENHDFILHKVVDEILSRLTEINRLRDRALLYARRTTKFKNTTRAYLELKEYANYYSKLLGFSTNRFNTEIDAGIKELREHMIAI